MFIRCTTFVTLCQTKQHLLIIGGVINVTVIVIGHEIGTRGQTLDEAVNANAFGKDINPSVLRPFLGQNRLFSRS